jgi:subtilisin-like proprotein convertase family protein
MNRSLIWFFSEFLMSIIKRLSFLFLLIFVFSCSDEKAGVSSGLSEKIGPDPLASYLWYFFPLSSTYLNGKSPTSGSSINLEDVHDEFKGLGSSIIVSDSSVDLSHPDLKGNASFNLSKNYNLSSPYFGDPAPVDDDDAHGTAVASLALARKNNAHGAYGVAPEAKLIGNNFLSSEQSLAKFYDQTTFDDGEGIFNYSYGYSNDEINPPYGQILNYLRGGSISDGHIYVTAAGNDYLSENSDGELFLGNANFDQMKSSPFMIVVGSTNAKSKFSSYSTPGANVWISAPGGDSFIGMLVADLVGCEKGFTLFGGIDFDHLSSEINPNCSYYSAIAGTSFAAPIVSGAIGVLKEINPELSWREVKHVLALTATKIDPFASSISHPLGDNLAGHTYQYGYKTNAAKFDFHPNYGFGMLNLRAAVDYVKSQTINLGELKTTDDMQDSPTYFRQGLNLLIPNNPSSVVESIIDVNQHDLVIEHVLVKINITHSSPKNLGIELVSPQGMVTKLMPINSGMSGVNLTDTLFGANAFYGESSRGEWRLKIVDAKSGPAGKLNAWSLSILGHTGDKNKNSNRPASVNQFRKSATHLIWDAPENEDITRYEICITKTNQISSGCKDGDWRPVLSGTTHLLSHYFYRGYKKEITAGVSYTAFIRLVNSYEIESEIESLQWVH